MYVWLKNYTKQDPAPPAELDRITGLFRLLCSGYYPAFCPTVIIRSGGDEGVILIINGICTRLLMFWITKFIFQAIGFILPHQNNTDDMSRGLAILWQNFISSKFWLSHTLT